MSATMSLKRSSASSTRSTSTISVTSITNGTNIMSGPKPCSASENLVLHAHGSSVHCLRHESLVLERRFERHNHDVTIISVDNSASYTSGSRVVTVDTSRTAIIWDMATGEEISRHCALEDILVATWMKNGNLVFGVFGSTNSSVESLFLTCVQVISWEMSSSSIPRGQNESRREPSTIRYARLRLQLTARLLF